MTIRERLDWLHVYWRMGGRIQGKRSFQYIGPGTWNSLSFSQTVRHSPPALMKYQTTLTSGIWMACCSYEALNLPFTFSDSRAPLWSVREWLCWLRADHRGLLQEQTHVAQEDQVWVWPLSQWWGGPTSQQLSLREAQVSQPYRRLQAETAESWGCEYLIASCTWSLGDWLMEL